MTPEQVERYKRHLLVKEIGGPGQNKLLDAIVVIVGAGALGGQIALSLAASGIGTLHIFDDDLVELSNLHRQTHFSMSDIGRSKVNALADRIEAVNPNVSVICHQKRWSENEETIKAQLLLDGSDNFETRFEMNRWSRQHDIPFVTGAVAGWQGQFMLLNIPGVEACPCYQCFVPEKPSRAGDCNDLGTLGMVTGLVAQNMALIAVKHILGLEVTPGDLCLFEGLSGRQRSVRLQQDPECPVCNS